MPIRSFFLSLIGVLFLSAGVFAQQMQMQPPNPEDFDEVTDEELVQFVDSIIDAQVIEATSQEEMVKAVEDNGVDVDTYVMIVQSMQQGVSEEDIDATAEDIEKTMEASEEVAKIQEEMQEKIQEKVEEHGLTWERFQEISMMLQMDPDLMMKAQQMIEERQEDDDNDY